MSQLVRGEPVQADCGCRRVEDVAPEVQVPRDRSAPGDDDECVGGFAGHGDREVVDQKTRNWHRPGLMRLWSSPDQLAANLADSLGNAQSMPRQIDPADLQRRQLAPPETAVRQE